MQSPFYTRGPCSFITGNNSSASGKCNIWRGNMFHVFLYYSPFSSRRLFHSSCFWCKCPVLSCDGAIMLCQRGQLFSGTALLGDQKVEEWSLLPLQSSCVSFQFPEKGKQKDMSLIISYRFVEDFSEIERYPLLHANVFFRAYTVILYLRYFMITKQVPYK